MDIRISTMKNHLFSPRVSAQFQEDIEGIAETEGQDGPEFREGFLTGTSHPRMSSL